MSKVKQASQKPAASVPEKSGPVAVPGRSWDPLDSSNEHNADQPVYASPKAEPHQVSPISGSEIREGAGEPRPMFSQSFKE